MCLATINCSLPVTNASLALSLLLNNGSLVVRAGEKNSSYLSMARCPHFASGFTSMVQKNMLTNGFRNTHSSRVILVHHRAHDYIHLPPEIWHLIIREATFMTPDPLDTTNELSFLEATSLHLPAYRASMHFKIALSLVCKRWNAFVKPFLHEFVWISRAQQAKALAHTLLLEFVD